MNDIDNSFTVGSLYRMKSGLALFICDSKDVHYTYLRFYNTETTMPILHALRHWYEEVEIISKEDLS